MSFRYPQIIAIVAFICRLAVGTTLLLSGLSKALTPYDFLARLYSYGIFSAVQG
jgi:hypothetical protein